jgi:hypothetical protein
VFDWVEGSSHTSPFIGLTFTKITKGHGESEIIVYASFSSVKMPNGSSILARDSDWFRWGSWFSSIISSVSSGILKGS